MKLNTYLQMKMGGQVTPPNLHAIAPPSSLETLVPLRQLPSIPRQLLWILQVYLAQHQDGADLQF